MASNETNSTIGQGDRKDLVRNMEIDNPPETLTERGLEASSTSRNSTVLFGIHLKCSKDYQRWIIQNWTNIVLALILLTLLVLVCVGTSNNNKYLKTSMRSPRNESLKCKICGEDTKFHTMLGDVVGGVCHDVDQTVHKNHDCGTAAACFKMDVKQSDATKHWLAMHKPFLQNISHPMMNDPMLQEGTLRGCVKGFTWDEKCHFLNTSIIELPHSPYWTTSYTCACVTDNCN